MLTTAPSPIAVCLALTRAINSSRSVNEIYDAALDALAQGLSVSRASILLFDPDGVMRFKAWRGLSDRYRAAVEGHTPWSPDSRDPQPIVVANVARDESLAAHLDTIVAEGIGAMAFIPLVSRGRVIGKFMLYYGSPNSLTQDDLQMVGVISAQVAFAVERTRAEAAAEQGSRAKDEFLATLSHELRTPLNAVIGWVQMFEANVLSADQQRQAIQVIGRNARLQAQLIEDILDVSRIVSGKLEFERVPLLVSQVVDLATSGAMPPAQARHITIRRDIPPELPPVMGDAARLQQVLGNVLSNAVKFTPEAGHIAVLCRADRDWVTTTVRDDGAGIDPLFLPLIFDRFRQADSRSTRKHGGLGLGLAIARHIVEQHGGDIRAESAGAGTGTTIEIRLPVAEGSRVSFTALRSEPIRLATRSQDLKAVTVLVVDDQRDSRELLATVLEECGATVLQEASALDALARLEKTPVTLLVGDIAMPEMDGYELVRRALCAQPSLTAIAVSAYAHVEDRHRAFAAGYQSYCTKPVDVPEFLRVVRDALAHNAGMST